MYLVDATEDSLVQAVKRPEDFDGFFANNYAAVTRALYLGLGNAEEAEDAAQEAFARAYAHWPSVSKADRPGTWVFVVAIREARRQRRRRLRDRLVARADRGAGGHPP